MEPRYTLADLLRIAGDQGCSPSARLVFDWVELGLLDRPRKHGLGRGKGSTATWPDEQRQLFLALLVKRREGIHIDVLCNIPVWLWLHFGDRIVPLRQVRRALSSWGRGAKGASWHKGRAVAAKMIEVVRHPKSLKKDRLALRDEVAQMLYCGSFEGERLLPLVARVVDPRGTGQPRGPAGAQLTPANVVSTFEARNTAIVNLSSIDDSLLHWAHFQYLAGTHDYLAHQPSFATDPELGRHFPPPSVDDLASSACLDLVTVLGLGLAKLSEAGDGSIEHPRTWLDRRLRFEGAPTVKPPRARVIFSVTSGQEHSDN